MKEFNVSIFFAGKFRKNQTQKIQFDSLVQTLYQFFSQTYQILKYLYYLNANHNLLGLVNNRQCEAGGERHVVLASLHVLLNYTLLNHVYKIPINQTHHCTQVVVKGMGTRRWHQKQDKFVS